MSQELKQKPTISTINLPCNTTHSYSLSNNDFGYQMIEQTEAFQQLSKNDSGYQMIEQPEATQSESVHVTHQTSNNLFEFLSDQSFEMSHAEDIFLCGKLLPLQQQKQNQNQAHAGPHANDNVLKAFHQKRCESLSHQIPTDRLCTSPRRLRRNSRSLNCRRMSRDYETSPYNSDIVRGLSQNKSPPSHVEELKVSKPRWYLMLFGLLAKIHNQEMDLHDIKIRQTRRKSSFEGIQNETSKGSWGMLNVLSCKSNASIAVASGSGRGIVG